MPIKTTAECDGPDCEAMWEIKDKAFPSEWLVITVNNSRFIGLPTGQYGFHSNKCFVRWANHTAYYGN